jgi:predicted dehydrogenase
VAKAIGVGIIGTGFGAKVHVPGFQVLGEDGEVEVLALMGRSREQTAELAARHHIPHPCTSLEELLTLSGLQAVSIASPPFLHYEQAHSVLRAGKHLLVEKPLTLTADESRTLLTLAEERGVVHGVDFEFRCIPHCQYLHELLVEGAIGPLYLVTVDWLVEGRADPRRPHSWYAEAARGGGVLGSLGSHVFDYLGWLFGPLTRIHCRLDTLIRSRPDPQSGEWLSVDSDDSAQIWLELADGTPVNVRLCTAAWQGIGHRLAVHGEQGSLILANESQRDYVHGFRLLSARPGEDLVELTVPERLQFTRTFSDGRLAPFIGIAARFVQAIGAGTAMVPSLREGHYAQVLMDAAHRSHREGRWLEVPTLEFPSSPQSETPR